MSRKKIKLTFNGELTLIYEDTDDYDVQDRSEAEDGTESQYVADRPHICEFCRVVFTTRRSVIRHYSTCPQNSGGDRGNPRLATEEELVRCRRASTGRPKNY